MDRPVRLSVNGHPVALPGPPTVASLLASRGLGTAPCAVEVNEVLVPRREHAERILRDGDRVEIVTLVGGG